MKKKLGFLFAFTVCVVLFGSCNNATKEDGKDGVTKKTDTVVVKPDSNIVKEKIKN